MPDIQGLIDRVIYREGGYVDDPDDRGGAPKYGITQRTLSEYVGKPQTKDRVRALSHGTATAIYKDMYYLKPGIHKLPEVLQEFMFDCAVNHGPSVAVKFLQKVYNDFVMCAGLELNTISVDGVLGTNTADASYNLCDKVGHDWVLLALVEERMSFYSAIVGKDGSQSKFYNGWINRAKEFLR